MENPTPAMDALSPEQIAALNDEQKTIFAAMVPADQAFFAKTFKPADLPGALMKKGELMKRNQADAERLSKLRQVISENTPASPAGKTGEDILGAAATALGIGGAAALVATDNSAHYQGVSPQALVAPLRTEFQNGKTLFSTTGTPEALVATVSFLAESQGQVPAMTINLTRVNDGLDVKVNELTPQGILESIKSGGKKLLDLAGQGLNLLNRNKNGDLSPQDFLSAADQTVEKGASLVGDISNLKLKERAWRVIRQTSEPLEAQYRVAKEEERRQKEALEAAWDHYYACPTCGVPFGSDDRECRVCGSARPEAPLKPDPRKAG